MANRIPLTEAAFRMRLSYQQVRNKLLRGELKGGRDDFGRLYVDAAEVAQWQVSPDAEPRQE